MITVRPLREADLPDIERIQRAAPQASQWAAREYLECVSWVIVVEDQPAGFLVLRSLGDGEWEILNLAVHPGYRRRGLAAKLLQSLPQGDVFLEVRVSNLPARKLYEGAGFQLAGTRKNYYHNPLEDALLLRRASPPSTLVSGK